MSPKLTRSLPAFATFLLTLSPLCAQRTSLYAPLTPGSDPANLAGERVSAPALADTLPINQGAPALQQLLLKLRTRASMMLIVAHPDDEDGGFLTFESRGAGARVAMLTLTRGEGGQNLMSADFNDALGLIRTQEILAADRYMGVDQFFGTEVDFGFSKTKEETFQQWTHDRVLYDAVRSVRLYRPLVLASVFVGGPTDGHGHHQVAGEITQEVFLAAADPTLFPEMGLPPWAPLKVYARVPFSRVTPDGMYDYATGKTIPTRFENYITGKITNAEPTATVLIHEGDPATVVFPGGKPQPALGMENLTYVQFARKGLGLQKTQIGPNVRLAPPGRSDTGYTLMASRLSCEAGCASGSAAENGRRPLAARLGENLPPLEQSVFQGIDTSLPGIAALAPAAPPSVRLNLVEIDHNLAEAQHLFNPADLELTVPPLREALRTLDSLLLEVEAFALVPAQKYNLLHELKIKRVELNNALVLAHGVQLVSAITPEKASPASSALETTSPFTPVQVTLENAGKEVCKLVHLQVENGQATAPERSWTVLSGDSHTENLREDHTGGISATRPYFSRPDLEQPFYTVGNPSLRNAPATPPPLVASASLDDQGVRLEVRSIVPDPAPLRAGWVPQPAVLVPPLSLVITPSVGILPIGEGSIELSTEVRASRPQLTETAASWSFVGTSLVLPHSSRLLTTRRAAEGSGLVDRFEVSPGRLAAGTPYKITAVATAFHHDYTESFRPVGYPGLTYTNLYTPATYRATAVNVTTAPNLRVAYLPGTGDSVPDFLPNLGVTPTLIASKDLTPGTLRQFDEVILGVRAYSAHADLDSAALQSFAEQGGVVILQYLSGGIPASAFPFPLALPGDPAHNVVVEAQPVTLLQPSAALLTWPNKISPSDFDHWVEERGHGFPSSWDPHFQALLETHDPDQDPQRGGLLVAPVGKGAYIYVAFALYRQLPEGVPGAYRLFANLLSYPKNPHR